MLATIWSIRFWTLTFRAARVAGQERMWTGAEFDYLTQSQAALTSKFKGAPAGAGGFIAHWIDLLDEARDRILHDHGGRMDRDVEHALELEAVKVSLKNLRTFPCIPEREAAGKLKLIGAYFAIRDGVLHVLDEAAGTFAPAA